MWQQPDPFLFPFLQRDLFCLPGLSMSTHTHSYYSYTKEPGAKPKRSVDPGQHDALADFGPALHDQYGHGHVDSAYGKWLVVGRRQPPSCSRGFLLNRIRFPGGR
jgi:hypothetical protein